MKDFALHDADADVKAAKGEVLHTLLGDVLAVDETQTTAD